ncbi:MAG: DUF3990 domain-containing protein [Treponema sp.]|nr:DUF3990 domain-containing protein [Treponema sp.]
MIVYHGSNTEISAVDLEKCRPCKDFGRGFYTTILKDQAWRMALRTVRRYGGNPCVTAFTIDENIFTDSSFKVLVFENPCEEWARFILNNRNPQVTGIQGLESNRDSKYDIVKGPVANDDLNFIFNQYVTGLVPIEYLVEQMKAKKLTNQISFHTAKAAGLLQRTGVFHD